MSAVSRIRGTRRHEPHTPSPCAGNVNAYGLLRLPQHPPHREPAVGALLAAQPAGDLPAVREGPARGAGRAAVRSAAGAGLERGAVSERGYVCAAEAIP